MTDEEFNAECRANDHDTPIDRYRNLYSAAILARVRSITSPNTGRDQRQERKEWQALAAPEYHEEILTAADYAGHADPEHTLRWILGLHDASDDDKRKAYDRLFRLEDG